MAANEIAVPAPNEVRRMLGVLGQQFPELDPDSVVTCLALIARSRRILEIFDRHFARYGLSQARYAILVILWTQTDRNWTPATISEEASVSRATMTGLLDGLERAGSIARQPHTSDRRKKVLVLTSQGRARLERMLPDHFTRLRKALDPIAKRRRAEVLKGLAQMSAALLVLEEGTK